MADDDYVVRFGYYLDHEAYRGPSVVKAALALHRLCEQGLDHWQWQVWRGCDEWNWVTEGEEHFFYLASSAGRARRKARQEAERLALQKAWGQNTHPLRKQIKAAGHPHQVRLFQRVFKGELCETFK